MSLLSEMGNFDKPFFLRSFALVSFQFWPTTKPAPLAVFRIYCVSSVRPRGNSVGGKQAPFNDSSLFLYYFIRLESRSRNLSLYIVFQTFPRSCFFLLFQHGKRARSGYYLTMTNRERQKLFANAKIGYVQRVPCFVLFSMSPLPKIYWPPDICARR